MNELAVNELRETVLDTGPRSFVVLGVAAAALILGVAACVLGHRRRSWRGLPGHLAVAAGSLVLLASGLVVAGAQAWRSVAIRHLLPDTRAAEDYVNDHMVNLGLRVQFAAVVFIGALVLLALIVVSLGLTLSWRTEAMSGHRSAAMSRLRAVALLLPAWPAAAGLLLYGWRMNAGFLGVAGTDPAMKTVEILRSIDGAYPIIETARVGLLLLVALGAIAIVLVSRRAALRRVSSGRLAASVVVFLAGLFAFTSTRGHAADRRPLPILPNDADASYASKVPSVSPCVPPESAPALDFTSELVRLNGAPADPDDEFRDHLLALHFDYPLIHAGRPMPFLIVEADRATPINRIIPYLQEVTEDRTILVASATSHPVLSKTLGTIARYQFCGRTFRLSYEPTATHLSKYRSWSDLAAAINRSSEVLEFTAW